MLTELNLLNNKFCILYVSITNCESLCLWARTLCVYLNKYNNLHSLSVSFLFVSYFILSFIGFVFASLFICLCVFLLLCVCVYICFFVFVYLSTFVCIFVCLYHCFFVSLFVCIFCSLARLEKGREERTYLCVCLTSINHIKEIFLEKCSLRNRPNSSNYWLNYWHSCAE